LWLAVNVTVVSVITPCTVCWMHWRSYRNKERSFCDGCVMWWGISFERKTDKLTGLH